MHQKPQHPAYFQGNRLRQVQPIPLRQHHGLQEKIEGVAVIAGREFPIYAILQDLLLGCLGQQGGSLAKPDGGPFLAPKHQSGNEERRGLTD